MLATNSSIKRLHYAVAESNGLNALFSYRRCVADSALTLCVTVTKIQSAHQNVYRYLNNNTNTNQYIFMKITTEFETGQISVCLSTTVSKIEDGNLPRQQNKKEEDIFNQEQRLIASRLERILLHRILLALLVII